MKPLTPIQSSAKGESCTFNMAGCNHNPETTVLCHDTRHVLGAAKRRCDSRSAYGCSECHSRIDGALVSHEIKGYIWDIAKMKTQIRLMEKGLLTFEGVENKPSKQLPRRSVL